MDTWERNTCQNCFKGHAAKCLCWNKPSVRGESGKHSEEKTWESLGFFRDYRCDHDHNVQEDVDRRGLSDEASKQSCGMRYWELKLKASL